MLINTLQIPKNDRQIISLDSVTRTRLSAYRVKNLKSYKQIINYLIDRDLKYQELEQEAFFIKYNNVVKAISIANNTDKKQERRI